MKNIIRFQHSPNVIIGDFINVGDSGPFVICKEKKSGTQIMNVKSIGGYKKHKRRYASKK